MQQPKARAAPSEPLAQHCSSCRHTAPISIQPSKCSAELKTLL